MKMFGFFGRTESEPTSRSEDGDRIPRLASKIADLVAKDTKMTTFGAADGHRYRMHALLSGEDLARFEREFDVRLPQDYADFLTQIGNGGIGPYYGLCSLKESVSDDPAHQCRNFLASPFPLTKHFNPFGDDQNVPDSVLFNDSYICGSIVLSHEGCGYYCRLVTTGPQAGQVWADGRVSDQGIIPLGCDFYTWYDRWVTEAIDDL